MKSSRMALIAVICVVIAAIAVYVGMRQGRSSNGYQSPDDFLSSVRKDAATSRGPEEGYLPGINDKQGIPRIELPKDTLDLGVVPNSHTTVVDFPIKNSGEADLVIGDIATSCHCTEGAMAEGQQVIKPGAQGILKVALHPDRVPDGFSSHKVLTIRSNDPQRPMVTLDVLSKVDPEFSVVPESIELGTIPKGKPQTKTLHVRQISDAPFAITQVEAARPEDMSFISASFEKSPENTWAKPGHAEYDIKVTINEEAPVGALASGIKIHNTCPRQNVKDLYVPVTATINAFYRLSAPRLTIGASARGKQNAGSVTLEADRAFEVTALSVSESMLTVSSSPGGAPNTQTISVGISPDATPGVKNGAILLSLKSGDESFTERIPVQVIVVKDSPGRKGS